MSDAAKLELENLRATIPPIQLAEARSVASQVLRNLSTEEKLAYKLGFDSAAQILSSAIAKQDPVGGFSWMVTYGVALAELFVTEEDVV